MIAQGRVISCGAEERLVGNDKAILSVLDIYGSAVHSLVDPQHERPLGAEIGLQILNKFSVRLEEIFVAVYVLPANNRSVVYEIVAVSVVPGPAGEWLAVSAAVERHAVYKLDAVRRGGDQR